MSAASPHEDNGNWMRCRNAGRYSSLHSFRQYRWSFLVSNLGSTESVLDPPNSGMGKAGPFPWKSSWHSRGDSEHAGYTWIHSKGRDQLCPLGRGLENFVGAGKDCTIQRIRRKCSNRRTRMSKEKRHESAGQEKRAVVSWGWSYVAGGPGSSMPSMPYSSLWSRDGFPLGRSMVASSWGQVPCGSNMKGGPEIGQLEPRDLSACWSHIPG